MASKKSSETQARGVAAKDEQPPAPSILDIEYQRIFHTLDPEGKGTIKYSDLIQVLSEMGIRSDDPRIRFAMHHERNVNPFEDHHLDFNKFKALIKESKGSLISDAIQGKMIIPDFTTFRQKIKEVYDRVASNNNGSVATYIPQLGRVDPNMYAVSICTINGQQISLGDANTHFCIQSISKPINYCLALEEHGEDFVHKHVGREPSGHGFNSLSLNTDSLPHNSMINSGAIMTCSMVRPQLEMADRFDYVLDTWARVCGGKTARFNNSVYLSERQTADRNFALGYFMREHNAFPENTNLIDTLEFYFQCCSIEVTCDAMSVAAATLANGGICPLSGERIFQQDTVKNCLSLMYSCGMYDFSGEFAFTIGLPAKSGVAGGLMVVVPNLLGIAIWSPRLDEHGNSVRGIEFCKDLVKTFNFHNYDSLISTNSKKIDPRLRKHETKIDGTIALCFAASTNDLLEVKQLIARGVTLNDADYDGRTALHLSASEGHFKVVAYLVSQGADVRAIDRWGNTPYDDALRGGHQDIVEYLSAFAS